MDLEKSEILSNLRNQGPSFLSKRGFSQMNVDDSKHEIGTNDMGKKVIKTIGKVQMVLQN